MGKDKLEKIISKVDSSVPWLKHHMTNQGKYRFGRLFFDHTKIWPSFLPFVDEKQAAAWENVTHSNQYPLSTWQFRLSHSRESQALFKGLPSDIWDVIFLGPGTGVSEHGVLTHLANLRKIGTDSICGLVDVSHELLHKSQMYISGKFNLMSHESQPTIRTTSMTFELLPKLANMISSRKRPVLFGILGHTFGNQEYKNISTRFETSNEESKGISPYLISLRSLTRSRSGHLPEDRVLLGASLVPKDMDESIARIIAERLETAYRESPFYSFIADSISHEGYIGEQANRGSVRVAIDTKRNSARYLYEGPIGDREVSCTLYQSDRYDIAQLEGLLHEYGFQLEYAVTYRSKGENALSEPYDVLFTDNSSNERTQKLLSSDPNLERSQLNDNFTLLIARPVDVLLSDGEYYSVNERLKYKLEEGGIDILSALYSLTMDLEKEVNQCVENAHIYQVPREMSTSERQLNFMRTATWLYQLQSIRNEWFYEPHQFSTQNGNQVLNLLSNYDPGLKRQTSPQ
ncbi:hypothetical protein ACFLZX_04230 [Nanoarchaeota archaeon]